MEALVAEYDDRLRTAGDLAARADELLRDFAQGAGLHPETTASLLLRGHDRRAVVFQPSPKGSKMPGLRVQFHAVTDHTESAGIRRGIQAVGGRVEPIFSVIPLRILVDRWNDVVEHVLQPFFQLPATKRSLVLGDRVRTRRVVERYPYAVVPSGASGTVIESDDDILVVRLDETVEGLESWSNEVQWLEADPLQDLERIDNDQSPGVS